MSKVEEAKDEEDEKDDIEVEGSEEGESDDEGSDSYGSEIDHSSYYKEEGSDNEESDGGDFFKSKLIQRDIASEDEEAQENKED